LSVSGDDLVEVSAKANFRSLGKRFGKQTPQVAAAVTAADAAQLSQQLRTDGSATLSVADTTVVVEPDDVIFTETPRAGWVVQHAGGESIALDLTLTPELRRVGLARDVIRLLQQARKSSGFEVNDRINVEWSAIGELETAINEHQRLICDEVLAVSMRQLSGLETQPDTISDQDLGLRFRVSPHGPSQSEGI
ncbi:MAG: DUF5915 domain-containing protein, partial [Candidatus Nanopelagicales bacterium]